MNKNQFDIIQEGNLFIAHEYLPNGNFRAKCCDTMPQAFRWIKERKAI